MKILDWLDKKSADKKRRDFEDGFGHIAVRVFLKNEDVHELSYIPSFFNGDQLAGAEKALALIPAIKSEQKLLEEKIQEVEAYHELFAALEICPVWLQKAEPNIPPTLETILANNELPDWPEIWAGQDEDGGWWAYRAKPTETYTKADHSSSWKVPLGTCKRLIPPVTFNPNWKQTLEKIRG